MTSAQAVRAISYAVLITTGILMGAEAIRGWTALVLMIAGVAGVTVADRLAKKLPTAGAGDSPARGLWHRVRVYLGLADDPELTAYWDTYRPDAPATAIGFVLGIAAILTFLTLIVVVVRLVM